MQADLRAVLGNTATARSDTVKIRSYGEVLDKSGKILARAYCEALVQRTPEYADPTNQAGQDPNATVVTQAISAINAKFGRRFALLSLRWLSPGEV